MKLNFNKEANRGFTLIELLVVIAIIGILASVVLASLNSARTSGADASVKANLNNLRAAAELYYSDSAKGNGDYVDFCIDPGTTNAFNAIMANSPATSIVVADGTAGTGTTIICHDGNATTQVNWVAAAPLNSTGYFCVDSTGFSGNRTNPVAAGTFACPSS